MRKTFTLALLMTVTLAAQTGPPFAGVWTLNRPLSEFPKEIGFNVVQMPPADDRQKAAAPAPRPESYEDAQRIRLLTGDARNPATRLMIVDNAAAVTITNELGQSRTFHPNGKEEPIEIQGVAMTATTTRDGDRLVVTYHVEPDRDVRYTYSASTTPPRLVVDAQFLDHGKGDKVTRVYDAGLAPAAQQSAAPPPQSEPAREAFDQRPGAEFKGLKSVGILVEDLGPEAAACGLKRDAIEEALTRRLAAGGLTVRRNSDEDTYVYVNVITTGLPNGTCVTRYDAFLYTHATAKLSYRDQPVLVQVSLMHRGGMGTSGAAGHAAAVSRGLEGYIDLFITQIKNANN